MHERERQTQPCSSGIMFSQEDKSTGLDILLESGSVRAWPGRIYTLSRDHIEAIIPILEARGIKYQVNYSLPQLPPMPQSMSWPHARRLGELDGWHHPNMENPDKIETT